MQGFPAILTDFPCRSPAISSPRSLNGQNICTVGQNVLTVKWKKILPFGSGWATQVSKNLRSNTRDFLFILISQGKNLALLRLETGCMLKIVLGFELIWTLGLSNFFLLMNKIRIIKNLCFLGHGDFISLSLYINCIQCVS